MSSKMHNIIPHAQIKRIMNDITTYNIGKEAISYLETLLIARCTSICKEALRIMKYKKVVTLSLDSLEFEVIDAPDELKFQISPIKRMIKDAGIIRISKDAILKIINNLVKYVRDITNEAVNFAKHDGRITILKKDITWSLNYLD